MDNAEKRENNREYCCSEHKKERSADEKKELLNRLARIEGQVRGIARMVTNDAYCVDLLTQSAAVTSAIASFEKLLLDRHIRECVADSIRHGDDGKIDELMTVIGKLM